MSDEEWAIMFMLLKKATDFAEAKAKENGRPAWEGSDIIDNIAIALGDKTKLEDFLRLWPNDD